MKINILGVPYTIARRTEQQDTRLHDRNGYCDQTSKLLVVEKNLNIGLYAVDDMDSVGQYLLRHEMMHAFFYEAGMQAWCDDEQLVDWIALQMPKLVEAMRRAGALAESG